MQATTTWHRLNIAFWILIVLLLAGVGLALWAANARATADTRSEQLAAARSSITYKGVLISDTVRGLLLDPGNQLELQYKREAEDALTNQLNSIQATFAEHPGLVQAVSNLNHFSSRTLADFHQQVLDTAARGDSAAATLLYNKEYPDIRNARRKLFDDLTAEIDSLRSAESKRAGLLGWVGLAPILILLLAIPIVGRVHSATVTRPLNRLVAALERMRQGDFTERLTVTRQDEFGILSENLNRVADNLSDLVGQVQRSGIQVNTTATEIAATAREQQTTAHEIATTTAEIGATSKQISATSRELVKTISEVNEVSEQTADLAGSGHTAITRMETTMRQIVEAAAAITAKLSVLSEKTTNVNSVVTTITKVADQTNLLSLNAAIEAEKAGEYGLGFAVVAMEIRRLADQTAVATFDIEKMVKEMQSAVAAGVMSMDKFSEEARRGVEEIRQVSTHLAQILHQVQTLTPRFQTVNEGMNAQATGAQQISDTLTQLTEASQQTAESLRQSNLAIEQLNSAARGLQVSVARFKLPS
ncbi:MAG TPA: methyl-accepting chemotaxis protein [Candidatus Paceibacterota bacterium]|nr:methyl-accepting chemotaxis protein [Verrucomicrobiota bacterium]HSA11166.1 methyl-accepting chemotaxis protein [Candidatus Paceibacterota bacterium]